MLSISAACISVSRDTGVNLNNLLFAGQTLPESNGGLDGTPTLVHKEADVPLITAVFDGEGEGGERSAVYAANAFRSSLEALGSTAAPEALLEELVRRLIAADAPGLSSAAVCILDHKLYLADLGTCQAYLLRGRRLYRLSAADGTPSGSVHAVSGTLCVGDRLLLCTGGLDAALPAEGILRSISSVKSPADALRQLTVQARSLGSSDSLTAVLLRVDA